jgi:addiction module RelB/DinJ family antitoxin
MDIVYNKLTMNNASLFVKTDPKIKQEAQETAAELGISLSSIVNAFLRQFVRTKTIHFSVDDEIPSPYLQELMRRGEEDLKAGNTSPKFKTADELIEYLHKQAA